MEIHNVQIFMTAWFIYMLSHTSDPKTSETTRKQFRGVSAVLLALTVLNLFIKII